MGDVEVRDVRGEIADDAETLALIDRPDSTEEIPTLDIAPYLDGRARMVRENAVVIGFGGWAPLYPAAAIALLAVGVNLVVDWVVSTRTRKTEAIQ